MIRLPTLVVAVACTVVTGMDYLVRGLRLRSGSPTVA